MPQASSEIRALRRNSAAPHDRHYSAISSKLRFAHPRELPSVVVNQRYDIHTAVPLYTCSIDRTSKVDDNFRLEQQHLERTVVEIIRSRIRERVARHHKTEKEDRPNNGRLGGDIRQHGREFAAASSATIDYLLRIQTRREAPLAAADWQAIVRHVYKGSTADVQTVGVLVREAVSGVRGESSRNGAMGSKKGRQGDAGGVERSSVPFGIFLQVLLGYRLHGRLRWLRYFKEDFREASF